MTVESKKELRSIFNLKKIFFVLLGNTIYCAGIVAFVLPTGLVTGGTTGLGLIVNHYFGVPIELFAAIFNTVMFLLAVVLLGKGNVWIAFLYLVLSVALGVAAVFAGQWIVS